MNFDIPGIPVFIVTSCESLQSYHDPESEEEDVLQISGATAGDTLTPSPPVSESKEEKQTPDDGLEGEKKEDLPEQPPPVEEKPREGRNSLTFFVIPKL